MSHKKNGQLTSVAERHKHLRKFMKRQFWGAERSAGRKLILSELNESEDDGLESSDEIFLWADFNASHQLGLRLNCNGTIDDLAQQGIEFKEG